MRMNGEGKGPLAYCDILVTTHGELVEVEGA